MGERVDLRGDAGWRRFVDHVLGAPGGLPAPIRQVVYARAQTTGGDADGLPQSLVSFVDAVARRSYQVTDGQVAELRAAGWSEDQIFETAVAAAVGAASVRRHAARRAMDEALEARQAGDTGDVGDGGEARAPRHP